VIYYLLRLSRYVLLWALSIMPEALSYFDEGAAFQRTLYPGNTLARAYQVALEARSFDRLVAVIALDVRQWIHYAHYVLSRLWYLREVGNLASTAHAALLDKDLFQVLGAQLLETQSTSVDAGAQQEALTAAPEMCLVSVSCDMVGKSLFVVGSLEGFILALGEVIESLFHNNYTL
jgi:hypothetical protein